MHNQTSKDSIVHSKKIVFFGTLSLFSYATLAELLKQKCNIVTIAIAKNTPDSIFINSDLSVSLIQTYKHNTIELLAAEQDIPIIYVQNINNPTLLLQLNACEMDFLIVACFPYLIPQKIWALPKQTSLNIHPSLLPSFRGPTPLFWQLKTGNNSLGITIHKLNAQFDQGEILRQRTVSIKNGIRGRAIDRLLGNCAALMLSSLVANYCPKSSFDALSPNQEASYHPAPQAKDFAISLRWTAEHAFNFMRGTEEWKRPYPIMLANQQYHLSRALAYTPAGKQTALYHIEVNKITIRFARGLLQATLQIG